MQSTVCSRGVSKEELYEGARNKIFTEKQNVGTSFHVTVCHHYVADGNFSEGQLHVLKYLEPCASYLLTVKFCSRESCYGFQEARTVGHLSDARCFTSDVN